MSILLNGVIFLFRIDEIFKSEETKHRLTLFKTEYIKWLETQLFEKNLRALIIRSPLLRLMLHLITVQQLSVMAVMPIHPIGKN